MLPREVFTAALKKDMTAVQDWLAQGGNPNEGLEQRTQTGFYVYQAGTTLLMVAAYRGRLDVVRLLVEAGADVNVRLPDDGRKEIAASCRERAATLGQELTLRQNPVKSRLEVQRRLLITRNTKRANRYAETADILAGVRLAGHSYKRWVLKDYMALLRLRLLLARGRARHGPETTVVAARLFGSLNVAE